MLAALVLGWAGVALASSTLPMTPGMKLGSLELDAE